MSPQRERARILCVDDEVVGLGEQRFLAHVAGAEHGLDAAQLGPRVAVAQDPEAPGIGGDRPADRRRVPAGQVHAVGPARRPRACLEVAHGDPRPGRDLAGCGVDLAEGAKPPQAEHQLPPEGDAPPDEAGVAALSNHPGSALIAKSENPRDLRDSRWSDHREGTPMK